MKSVEEIHELTYDLIKRAVHGEQEALEKILMIYDPYLTSLVTKERVGAGGKIHKIVDEDKKIMVQMHLVKVIQKK